MSDEQDQARYTFQDHSFVSKHCRKVQYSGNTAT